MVLQKSRHPAVCAHIAEYCASVGPFVSAHCVRAFAVNVCDADTRAVAERVVVSFALLDGIPARAVAREEWALWMRSVLLRLQLSLSAKEPHTACRNRNTTFALALHCADAPSDAIEHAQGASNAPWIVESWSNAAINTPTTVPLVRAELAALALCAELEIPSS